jgi:pseudouridine-5'-phosphate glycosidase
VESPEEAAAVVRAARALGYRGGVLVAWPVAEADEVPYEEVEPLVESALAEAAAAGVTGGAVTPFVLERVAKGTGGRTIRANVALVGDNARVAARLAVALASSAG